MRWSHWWARLGLTLLLFGTESALVLTTHADEARSFAITEWDGNCKGSKRVWWDDMCKAWRDRMDSKGWQVAWANFDFVRVSRFADPSRESWGVDNGRRGMDRGNAALICTHGGRDGDGWFGVMHSSEHGECSINVPQMNLGSASGGRLRFLHLSSCNSVQWDKKGTWWGPAVGRVHAVTGFHGFMYIGRKYVDEYRDLAKHGFSSKGVGKVWVDEMHHVDHWYNSWSTVCPVALGFGDTREAAKNALNERYSSDWRDQRRRWMSWRYKSKCDPKDGDKLPK